MVWRNILLSRTKNCAVVIHKIKKIRRDENGLENEITVIAGKNGCGKSTLLKVIAGLIKPMKGQVLLEKNNELLNLHTLSDKLRARQIAYLPQK